MEKEREETQQEQAAQVEQDLKAVGEEAIALEQRLLAVEEELRALKDRYVRLLADFDNYRKRMEEELRLREREGILRAVRALLPVLDDLERALEFAEANPESILTGVKAMREGFFRILAGLGIEEVPGEGEALVRPARVAVGEEKSPEEEGVE